MPVRRAGEKKSNFQKNGQLIAPADKIITDAIHAQIIRRNQIDPSKGVFFYWDPHHEANPLAGPWVEGYRWPAAPEPIVNLVQVHLRGGSGADLEHLPLS